MWQDNYAHWLQQNDLPEALLAEIKAAQPDILEDMFYTSMEFGTGGMRGILGAGTNRLNIFTIRKANDGLARYLLARYGKDQSERGVVIAHDNRLKSRDFALESAKVLGCYGIKSYVFEDLRPTPELSFAVRYLHALAGIVITASHNPPNYNGYKIYDEYGCQYTPQYADQIIKKVEEVTDVFSVKTEAIETLEAKGLLSYIGKEIDDAYIDMVLSIRIHPDVEKKIGIVFSPLHGTSAPIAPRVMRAAGYAFDVVEAQMVPDPMFSTLTSPNPENASAFQMAIELGKCVSAELLIATDPDADRLGVAVAKDGGYVLLTGNQTGAILIHYLLSQKRKLGILPPKGVVFNTIVTSDLGAKIARSYGFDVVSTLTGFKFIGEQARLLESTDKAFIFGYEESYGYVISDEVRDKDAIQALLLIIEAASFFRQSENKALWEILEDIYHMYGYYREKLLNVDLKGLQGKKRIERIMKHFQTNHLPEVASIKVRSIEDYEAGIRYHNGHQSAIDLPKSAVIKYVLEDDSWFVLRPSGTEPKLKIYFGTLDTSADQADARLSSIEREIASFVEAIE